MIFQRYGASGAIASTSEILWLKLTLHFVPTSSQMPLCFVTSTANITFHAAFRFIKSESADRMEFIPEHLQKLVWIGHCRRRKEHTYTKNANTSKGTTYHNYKNSIIYYLTVEPQHRLSQFKLFFHSIVPHASDLAGREPSTGADIRSIGHGNSFATT